MKIVLNPIKPGLCSDTTDFHVLVRLQSEPQADCPRTPLNLALVLDRSGSMHGVKLKEAKLCAIDLVSRMAPDDQVAVIQYDDQIETIIPLGLVDEVRPNLSARVQAITANGTTDLHGGWLRGGETLAPFAGQESACHVILLSDGIANRGLTSTSQITAQVDALANAGVTTTTVGLGADFNEELMTAMAQAGQGRAHYGERAIDLAETFDSEIGLLTQLQWRSVQLAIDSKPSRLRVLNDYSENNGVWQMPSIAMGSECWALIRIPMCDAIQLQNETGTVISIRVSAIDTAGDRHTFKGYLETLPLISKDDFNEQPAHELVQRRLDEINAAQLQLQIRDAALRGDWRTVERILDELETLGRREPWIAASIAFIRQLMNERDEQRMSKEMMYKSRKMSQRLASTDELTYSESEQLDEAAFLRRKMAEGRRTDRL